jgi:hypothetical protein
VLYSYSGGSRVLILSVDMVLRLRLIVNTPFSRKVVDCVGDSCVESFVVHLPLIGLVGQMVLVGKKL